MLGKDQNMDEATIVNLLASSDEQICITLSEFFQKNQSSFTFPEFTHNLRHKFITNVVQVLGRPQSTTQSIILCLKSLRLLSRDRNELVAIETEEAIRVLLHHAGLDNVVDEHAQHERVVRPHNEVVVEAQKCLCNLIFNSQPVQNICCDNNCVDGIVLRLKTYKDPDLLFEIKFFDMRMLFLLTALCKDTRPKIQHHMHGMTYLVEVIDLALTESVEHDSGLTDQQVDLCCEILKILFNLTTTVDKNTLDEEEEAHYMRLVSVLRDLLVCSTQSPDKRLELQSYTVNLLTNMPRDCYEELLTPVTDTAIGAPDSKDLEYDGKNMEAIAILLEFLHKRMDKPPKNLKDSLTPILHCLCETCRANRAIRKFSRSKVLPPLREEVKLLPQEGNTLRNRLCALLTSTTADSITRELAADFLFVLCKESVQRMVKYTGYGNCSGLLSNRGLLFGGRGKGGDYSSDSEDSDTDEYSALCEKINPVTGRWEEPKASAMEGMSDEQKEFEAMKLVEMMDRLQRTGVVQPCKIGDDGKPHPVSHILELTKGVPDTATHSDSD